MPLDSTIGSYNNTVRFVPFRGHHSGLGPPAYGTELDAGFQIAHTRRDSGNSKIVNLPYGTGNVSSYFLFSPSATM